jgi:copper chaperone CopZ
MSETFFLVKNLKCGNCVARATEAVSKVPGVTGASFDFADGTGVVKGEFDADAVTRALAGAGYPAEVDD